MYLVVRLFANILYHAEHLKQLTKIQSPVTSACYLKTQWQSIVEHHISSVSSASCCRFELHTITFFNFISSSSFLAWVLICSTDEYNVWFTCEEGGDQYKCIKQTDRTHGSKLLIVLYINYLLF